VDIIGIEHRQLGQLFADSVVSTLQLCMVCKAVSFAQIPFLLKMTLFAVNPPVLNTKVAERKLKFSYSQDAHLSSCGFLCK